MRIKAFLKNNDSSIFFYSEMTDRLTKQGIIKVLNKMYEDYNIIWIKINGEIVLPNALILKEVKE